MQVVFIHGPPAVGKYTVALGLSKLTGLPLFHNHLAVDTALSLFPFGTSQFNQVRASIWRTVFREAALSQRSFIFTFAPESTVDPGLIGALIETVQSAGGLVHFVELTCARTTILARLGNEGRTAFRKLKDPKVFEAAERQGGFVFPALPAPILRLSTDDHSPTRAAQKIAIALSAAAQ